MDVPGISAIAALAGSAIGGFTSLCATWLSQRIQFKTQRLAHEVTRREQLYESFIEEAARLYADAYEHNEGEINKLVKLYALVGKMRLLSSAKTIAAADNVIRVIIATYQAPNRTFRDVIEILDSEQLNPLHEFSNACREELEAGARI